MVIHYYTIDFKNLRFNDIYEMLTFIIRVHQKHHILVYGELELVLQHKV